MNLQHRNNFETMSCKYTRERSGCFFLDKVIFPFYRFLVLVLCCYFSSLLLRYKYKNCLEENRGYLGKRQKAWTEEQRDEGRREINTLERQEGERVLAGVNTI